MKRTNLTTSIQKERQYVFLAGACLVGLVFAYMYFLSASVIHVVIRKEASQDIRSLQTEIATLEAEYIAAQHAVSADIASLQGFVETPNKIFLDRTDSTLVLSQVSN